MQTSDVEEARAIRDVHNPKEQSRETNTASTSAAESITVKQRIYNLIREEELVSKIPYPGCRTCKNGK